MSLFKPRHTAESVAKMLVAGLKDGTIVLDRNAEPAPVLLGECLLPPAAVDFHIPGVDEAPKYVSWSSTFVRIFFGNPLDASQQDKAGAAM